MEDRKSLFRTEVLLHKADRGFGTPVFQHHSFAGWFVMLSVMLVCGALVLLMLTRYKETEAVRGVLVPTGGAHRVMAATTATVQHIMVGVGDTVSRGDVLAALKKVTFDQRGKSIQQSEVMQLHVQRDLYLQEQTLQSQQYQQNHQQMIAALAELEVASEFITAEADLLQQQVQLGESHLSALQELQQGGAISSGQLDRARLEHLSLLLRVKEVAQKQALHLRQQHAQQAQLENLDTDLARAQLRVQQALQQIQSDINAVVNQVSLTVVAEADGIVASITVEPGQTVQPQQAMFYIDSQRQYLEATLYVPSRVLGRMFPGQELLLRYDAFNYQQFGRYAARVTSIDYASLDPREHLLPVQSLQESLFKVSAQLEQPYVEGPDLYRLQSGMLFNADVVMADMSLLEYIFKPVLRLRARLTS